MSAALPGVSDRHVCRVLNVACARLRAGTGCGYRQRRGDEVLAERLRQLIALHPAFGYRRLWALLCFAAGLKINRKAVYRVLRLKAGSSINAR